MKTSTKFAARIPGGLLFRLAVSLMLVPLSAGCSSGRSVGFDVHNPSAFGTALSPKEADDVEVWLDEAPREEIVVVGELEARAVESPVSIARMQKHAGAIGLDGIYWIECTNPCSGDCKAKGFIYARNTTSLAGRNIASR